MLKKSKFKTTIIVMLVLIEIVSLFLMTKSSLNKPIYLDVVGLRKPEKDKNTFAILLQSGNTYVESNTLPTSGYEFDTTKSGCMDEYGEKILINGVNPLSYNNGMVQINIGSTGYCYLYFNEVSLTPEDEFVAQFNAAKSAAALAVADGSPIVQEDNGTKCIDLVDLNGNYGFTNTQFGGGYVVTYDDTTYSVKMYDNGLFTDGEYSTLNASEVCSEEAGCGWTDPGEYTCHYLLTGEYPE